MSLSLIPIPGGQVVGLKGRREPTGRPTGSQGVKGVGTQAHKGSMDRPTGSQG